MPLRYLELNKKTNTKKGKKLLEIREVGKKTCGKPYPPSLNSSGVIQLFSDGGWGGGALKSFPGFEEGKTIKNNLLYKKRLKTI